MAELQLETLADGWLDHLDAVSRLTLGVADLRGARLARAVMQVSQVYTRERARLSELIGDDEALCARLKFFLSRDLLKVHGPIAELASVGAFPLRDRLRVLDLGAGLGATSLGLARSARRLGLARSIELTALDLDPEALEIMRALCRNLESLPGLPVALTTRVADLAKPLPLAASERYDVITIGLALNELAPAATSAEPIDRAAAIAERLAQLSEHLRDDGVLIAIEPALRETSRALHGARDRLVARPGPPHVFAPCLGPASCPMLERERDYCHERVPFALPERLATIAREAGLRDADLTYSYLTLHRAARSLHELELGAPLYRAVSGLLESKGKCELWLCGSHGAPRAMRLTRHASADNAALEHAQRGAVLRIEAAADRSDQARLRIERETRVELRQHWTAEPT